MEEHTIRAKFVALHPVMDERVTRLWAGAGGEMASWVGQGVGKLAGRGQAISYRGAHP